MTGSTGRLREKTVRSRGQIAAIVATLVFLGVVVQQSWAGNPITWDSILFFLIVGITFGSVYAVAAVGLVVTYTTSGIFNFAQGAIGMFGAFIFWKLHVDWGMQTLIAFLLTVFVITPSLGAVIEIVLMRRLSDAPLVAQIVTTLGLMLALMGLAATLWDPQTPRRIDRFFGTDGFMIGQTLMPWSRFITIMTGLLLAVGLKFLLSRTRLGVAMRAVVDNRSLAGLNGVKPGRVSMFSWALGSGLAAIAGIFLAEELASLDVQTLTLLIIEAFAAAIIGRLKNLPLTFFGGLLIGLAVAFQQNFLTWSGRWTVAQQSIPMVILFLALLFLPQARIEGKKLVRSVTIRIPKIRTADLRDVRPVHGRVGRPVPPRPARRAPARAGDGHGADHVVARPADGLVETDLPRADHLRRARARSRSSSGRTCSAPSAAVGRGAVRGADRRRHGASRVAARGSLPRARRRWRSRDGRVPLLPATRGPRVRRPPDPVDPHPGLGRQQAVRLPGHPLRRGRGDAPLHHRSAWASSGCSSSGCTRAASGGGSPPSATARPHP